MNRYKKWMLLFLICNNINTVWSQDKDSLMIYLEIAAKNNPTILQKYASYEAALLKIPQVGSLPDPELSAGILVSPMELMAGNQIADLRLMQMFPWFGTLNAAKDEMSLMAKAQYEIFRDTKLQVLFEVQQSWFDLYKVQQTIEISKKNLEILNTLERLSLIKFKTSSTGGNTSSTSSTMQNNVAQTVSSGSAGMQSMGNNMVVTTTQSQKAMPTSTMNAVGGLGLADLYRIQIEKNELENNIALLYNQKQTITARFNSFLNRPLQEPVKLPVTITSNSIHIPLLTVADSILAHNPMLTMLNFEKQSLEARKEMVTKMGYPMIGLGLNYSLIQKNPMSSSEMNGDDMIMPMFTLTLPINRKKYKAMQIESEKLKTATEYQINATKNALKTEYYQTVQEYEDAQRRIQLYANQYSLANQSLNILIKSFSASSAGLSEILIIRQQALNYQLQQIQAITDLNTAVVKLQRLMAYLPNP